MSILDKLKKLIAAHGGDASKVSTVHKAVDLLVALEEPKSVPQESYAPSKKFDED